MTMMMLMLMVAMMVVMVMMMVVVMVAGLTVVTYVMTLAASGSLKTWPGCNAGSNSHDSHDHPCIRNRAVEPLK